MGIIFIIFELIKFAYPVKNGKNVIVPIFLKELKEL